MDPLSWPEEYIAAFAGMGLLALLIFNYPAVLTIITGLQGLFTRTIALAKGQG